MITNPHAAKAIEKIRNIETLIELWIMTQHTCTKECYELRA